MRIIKNSGAERVIDLVRPQMQPGYPVLLLVECGHAVSVSLAHKRQALKEAGKVVLDGELVTVALPSAGGGVYAAFLQALGLARQPRASLYTLYQGWLDSAIALQASLLTGVFNLFDSVERAQQRRQALHASLILQDQIASLRSAATKASQLARQVQLNLEIKRLQAELAAVHTQL